MNTLEKLREIEDNFIDELEKLKIEALAQNEELWYRVHTETRREFINSKEKEVVYDSTRDI